jgi:NADH-quinone oxidoreductase subunit F
LIDSTGDGRRVLTRDFGTPGLERLGVYEEHGGFAGLRRALREMTPREVVDEIAASGLRGRSSGFPAGTKWGLIARDRPGPTYLVVNADESEPGCSKDRYLMENSPHMVLEGAMIAAYAIGAHQIWIYIRGEYDRPRRRLEAAVAELEAAGHLGPAPLGSAHALEVRILRGHGAYICGEETALLESIEGKRGQPRPKPPFPASQGLFGQPTLVSNVETFATAPWILTSGAAAYAAIGSPSSPGTRLFTVSGCVRRPGNYEMELGTPFRHLVEDLAGGPLPGHEVKCWWPGGSSFPILMPEHLDLGSDLESLRSAGTSGGSGGVIVLDDGHCVVAAARRLVEFYARESCGKCTPCRVGGNWAVRTYDALAGGWGDRGHLAMLDRIQAGLQNGRCLCVLGDSAGAVIASTMSRFRVEYEAHARGECRLCGLERIAATV